PPFPRFRSGEGPKPPPSDRVQVQPLSASETGPEMTEQEPPAFEFIDLFAGIGGLRIGLESIGGECVFSSEWDKFAQQTYKAWHGEEPAGDITLIDPASVPDHQILAAGFPCQPFSIAGVSKKLSLGRAHGFADVKQGNMFFALA